MRPAILFTLGAILLCSCGGGGGGCDDNASWSFTFDGGQTTGSGTGGGTVIVAHGPTKVAGTWLFGEPFPFAGELPPPGPAPVPPPGWSLVDSVVTPRGTVLLLAEGAGAPFLALAGLEPQPVPFAAARIVLAGAVPLRVLLVANGTTAIEATSGSPSP